MNDETFICWKAGSAAKGWIIYRVDAKGTADPLVCCRSYLSAARLLKAFRSGPIV